MQYEIAADLVAWFHGLWLFLVAGATMFGLTLGRERLLVIGLAWLLGSFVSQLLFSGECPLRLIEAMLRHHVDYGDSENLPALARYLVLKWETKAPLFVIGILISIVTPLTFLAYVLGKKLPPDR